MTLPQWLTPTAVPVMRWIGEGINLVEQAKQEGTL